MASDNAVPLTPEFVEREMQAWLQTQQRRLNVMFADGMPAETGRRRNILAKSFTTALFNEAGR